MSGRSAMEKVTQMTVPPAENPRVCKQCGKTFIPRHGLRLYCYDCKPAGVRREFRNGPVQRYRITDITLCGDCKRECSACENAERVSG